MRSFRVLIIPVGIKFSDLPRQCTQVLCNQLTSSCTSERAWAPANQSSRIRALPSYSREDDVVGLHTAGVFPSTKSASQETTCQDGHRRNLHRDSFLSPELCVVHLGRRVRGTRRLASFVLPPYRPSRQRCACISRIGARQGNPDVLSGSSKQAANAHQTKLAACL